MGLGISWDKEKQMIRVKGNGREVFVKEREQMAVVGEKRLDLGQPLLEIKERTMVPLSFFDQVLGFETIYEPEEKTVKIYTRTAAGN